MGTQIIYGVSNHKRSICYTLEKSPLYYQFLFKLLEFLQIPIPDFYDEDGNLPNPLLETDAYMRYYGSESFVDEIIGNERIFLIVSTNQRDELQDFIEKSCNWETT